mmetsp:Transcript_41130/g.98318  ORF Transcript_41130/g.98318 Transcript_41130/m.98318 type:complete len:202 (+) Transcript_41130:470-1075(+)
MLGCGVGGAPWQAEEPLHRGDLHDVAAVRRQPRREQGLGQRHAAEVVDRHDPLVKLQGRLGRCAAESHAAVVHEDVDPAKDRLGFLRMLRQGGEKLKVHWQNEDLEPRPQLQAAPPHALELPPAPRAQHQAPGRGGPAELHRQGLAQAARGAGDPDGLVAEVLLHCLGVLPAPARCYRPHGLGLTMRTVCTTAPASQAPSY